MKKFFLVGLYLFTSLTYSQISGTVTDSITAEPLQYVSVWIKNKPLGATTDKDGQFIIDYAKAGDTLVASFLGFSKKEIIAEDGMTLFLKEEVNELQEIVIIPMKAEREKDITSYRRKSKIKEQLFAGEELQYAAARFIKYQPEYEKTPFIKDISFVTMNSLNSEVPILVSLIKADENGHPTDQYILKNRIVYVEKGREEANIELSAEKLQVPMDGFFVVLERIYQEKYRKSNKYYIEGKSIKYMYEPSLGTVSYGQAENLWWKYGGNWFSPSQLQKLPFKKTDLAINVRLTN